MGGGGGGGKKKKKKKKKKKMGVREGLFWYIIDVSCLICLILLARAVNEHSKNE